MKDALKQLKNNFWGNLVLLCLMESSVCGTQCVLRFYRNKAGSPITLGMDGT